MGCILMWFRTYRHSFELPVCNGLNTVKINLVPASEIDQREQMPCTQG